ncbi:hypothetical protein RHOW815_001278 [Candidatus Rhabdochlamydia sp. W815]|nr:hypothetical protein RHOW815_001278 [Candidatus Rhabdochlamydia sp. W815]
MEKLRKKTTYKPEYGGSRFYCSTFEKILNRLLKKAIGLEEIYRVFTVLLISFQRFLTDGKFPVEFLGQKFLWIFFAFRFF